MHASFRSGATSLDIVWGAPPYERFELLSPAWERCTQPLPLGTVLCVRLRDVARDWTSVEHCVPALRQRYPASPVMLHFARAADADAVHLARRAAFLFVRAILVDDEPMASTLRQLATRPIDLAADVMEWLPLRGVRVPPECAPLIREVVRRAAAHRCTRDLLQELGESEHTVRKRLRARGLPAPSDWFAAARALHAALRLQSSSEHTLFDVALSYGYSDHSTLSRQMARLFGLRPSVVRELIGWEPLADRWVAHTLRARSHDGT
jgi:AraC-like DNA-binding protein